MDSIENLMATHDVRIKLERLDDCDLNGALEHYRANKEVCFNHMRGTIGVFHWKLLSYPPFLKAFPAECSDLKLFATCAKLIKDEEEGKEEEDDDDDDDKENETMEEDNASAESDCIERLWFGFDPNVALLFRTCGEICAISDDTSPEADTSKPLVISPGRARTLLGCSFLMPVPCTKDVKDPNKYELWMDEEGKWNNSSPNEVATKHLAKQQNDIPLYGNVLLVRSGTIE